MCTQRQQMCTQLHSRWVHSCTADGYTVAQQMGTQLHSRWVHSCTADVYTDAAEVYTDAQQRCQGQPQVGIGQRKSADYI
jgi:hypothetical protein